MFLAVALLVSMRAVAVDGDSENGMSLMELVLYCSLPSRGREAPCPEACGLWPEYCYYAVAAEIGVPGTCKLPPYPRIGGYSIGGIALFSELALADFSLFYTCPPGYILLGQHPRCRSGVWTADFPSCNKGRKCQLINDPSVSYNCINYAEGECPDWVSSGQFVLPECRITFMEILEPMRCVDGNWNYVATCREECGIVQSEDISGRGRVPWYSGVYSRKSKPYIQICGGSLVSSSVVISAAHCFWSDEMGVLPANNFAIAVGKINRAWGSSGDEGQTSDVRDVMVPPRFRGAITHFQEDISIVFLSTPVTFNSFVYPVCLDLNTIADEHQLEPGSVGKVAVWNLTPVLQVVELSYVDVKQCYIELPKDFLQYITSDKICAESTNGKGLCPGDSGSGLAFPSAERWYLRGVVSVAPRSEGGACVESSHTALTDITRHEAFIRMNLRIAGQNTTIVSSATEKSTNLL